MHEYKFIIKISEYEFIYYQFIPLNYIMFLPLLVTFI